MRSKSRSNQDPGVADGPRAVRRASDAPFWAAFASLGAIYVLLIVGMLVADATFTSVAHLRDALSSPAIRFSIALSLLTCTVSALLSVLIGVPIGYLMSRLRFGGKHLVDAILDIPIILPPLVVGLSLLILMQTGVGDALERTLLAVVEWTSLNTALEAIGLKPIRGITYDLPAIVLAQFAVACAFAVRTMRVTFDQIHPRAEQVAWTLGCRHGQAFWKVVLPEAWPGVLTAGTLAWARSMGEFGPILVFAGATRMKTEVLPTTIFLELSVGDIEAAVAVSLVMVTVAVLVLVLARVFGLRQAIY